MNKKMVCLDVDGTIVDFDGHMYPEVRAEIINVMEAGHHVLIATGRAFHATLPIARDLGLHSGYSVCSNGGVSLRLDPKLDEGFEVIARSTFDPSSVLDALSERIPMAKFAIEDDNGRYLSTERFQDFSFGIQATGVTFEELQETTAVRLVVFSQDSSTQEFAEAIETLGLQGITYSVGYNAWLDVAGAGVSKASGLEALRQILHVEPEDTVAIGDGFNDVEMLEWAGRGVAMGQAPREVKQVADEITGTVHDGGLATVLRTLL
ncbi:Cof-type HAD-IIB family hydrolase [Yaniella halotolerans]|uniref:Cof-type HAD-IIB family hydrolase n=1 Tax=Yaniella halotolerans TaxID=225453 RepID=UPI000497C662|nr:Cof-type HAD-IIB family hydrolase [Yaniella halotolerans]